MTSKPYGMDTTRDGGIHGTPRFAEDDRRGGLADTAPTMSGKPVPVTADHLKPGDRVRVTFEADVSQGLTGPKIVMAHGRSYDLGYLAEAILGARATIHRLPEPERPLAVGDRVRVTDVLGDNEGEILCIAEGFAFISAGEGRQPFVFRTRDCNRL